MFIKDLEITNLILSLYVNEAISNYMLLEYLEFIFSGKEAREQARMFRLNPVNTYAYRMMENSCHLQFISAVECVSEFKSRNNAKFSYSGFENLVCHRNYLSHPHTANWRKKMDLFIKSEKHIKDNKVIMLCDLKQYFELELLKIGSNNNPPLCLKFDDRHLIFASNIVRDSMNKGISVGLSFDNDLKDKIIEFFKEYINFHKLRITY